MKILIVDDSMIMRMAIEKFLQDLGLTLVGMAADGKQALELFKTHEPDLVTLDITMPEMDGLQVLDAIMALRPATKVIVVSAITEKSTVISALQKGARAFIQKPFDAQSIKEKIQELMQG